MVELKFTGMCEGCDLADLELINASTPAHRNYWITCSHVEVCRRAFFKLQEEKAHRNEPDHPI